MDPGCTLCDQPFNVKYEYVAMDCGHVFHRYCAEQKARIYCPECNQDYYDLLHLEFIGVSKGPATDLHKLALQYKWVSFDAFYFS